MVLVQTEIKAHEAVISSLYLRSQTQEVGIHPVDEAIVGMLDAIKGFFAAHHALMELIRKSNLSSIGEDATFKLTCSFSEMSDNLWDVLKRTWEIAPTIPSRFQAEYCRAAREVEKCHEDLEDMVETWCLSADPTLRKEILDTVKTSREESSNRPIADWREFLATL